MLINPGGFGGPIKATGHWPNQPGRKEQMPTRAPPSEPSPDSTGHSGVACGRRGRGVGRGRGCHRGSLKDPVSSGWLVLAGKSPGEFSRGMCNQSATYAAPKTNFHDYANNATKPTCTLLRPWVRPAAGTNWCPTSNKTSLIRLA